VAPQRIDPPDDEERLDEVIADYLDAEQANQAPDQEELLRSHPELGPRLARFFVEHQRFARLAGPLRWVAAPRTGVLALKQA